MALPSRLGWQQRRRSGWLARKVAVLRLLWSQLLVFPLDGVLPRDVFSPVLRALRDGFHYPLRGLTEKVPRADRAFLLPQGAHVLAHVAQVAAQRASDVQRATHRHQTRVV